MIRLNSFIVLMAVMSICVLTPLRSQAFLGLGSDPINREITSTPSGATIYYSLKEDESGIKLDTSTPLKDVTTDIKKYPHGHYRLEKEGFKPFKFFVPFQDKPSDIKKNIELQPVTTIRLKVTSNPPGAVISFGKDINTITKELGPAPYSESRNDVASEQKPLWEKGFYKALLKGYRPKVIASEQSEENKNILFELEPLPQPPEPPKMEYPDKKTVAWKSVNLDAYKNPEVDFSTGIPLAVMNFKEKTGMETSSQATDYLILKLQRKGYVVIEREIVEKAITDLKAATPADKQASSGIELIKELSTPLKVNYFLIGSITEYMTGNENITIVPFLIDKDKERYQKEYDAYMAYFKSENMPIPQPVKTLQEWELELNAKTQSFSMPVAKVGITAKILDVKSGRAVWTSIGSISENGLQKALNLIISSMADSITDPGDGKTDNKNKVK